MNIILHFNASHVKRNSLAYSKESVHASVDVISVTPNVVLMSDDLSTKTWPRICIKKSNVYTVQLKI